MNKTSTYSIKREFAQFHALGLRSIESNDRLVEQEIEIQMKKLQVNSLDFNTESGINWTIMQEILHFKTDSLLIHYLSKINQRIIHIADERGQTLLHYAVSLENSEAIYSLVKFAREVQNESQSDLEEWINSKTYLKSFSPILYAAN